ncbi:hypothetical protein ACQ4LE_004143 [Meloidogyne hapla]|uniref:Uncharacterized protein n=1 Tax=Meloidogyne hapla TaxID=6305 RepID=A0A1I8B8W2_MELHA
MVAIIADGISMRNHPSSLRVHDKIRNLYAEHSATEATGGGPKDRGRLTYAQIREAHRSGRPIEERPSEDKFIGEEGKQNLFDKKEQIYVKPSYLGTETPSDIGYMSGTPRGSDEGSGGDYGTSNERWK